MAKPKQTARTGPRGFNDPTWIAADFSSPIALLLTESALLEQRLGDRAIGSVARGLERISHSATMLERMLSDLVDLPYVDGGQLELKRQTVDLSRLLAQVIQTAVVPSERKRISLEVRNVPSASIDSLRVERALANAIHHAYHASSPTAPILVRLETRNDRACVSIADTSPGMTSAQANVLFERNVTACQHPCVSVGLYVGRKVVEAHGGRMGVESTPGRGSRIFVELPVMR